MATPRKRYFRVPDSVLREPWPQDVKLAYILLQAHLNTRWRRDGIPNEEAGRCTLSRGDLQNITGKTWVKSGQNLLRTLSELEKFSIEFDGALTTVDWPNYVEFQSFDSRSQGSEQARDEPPPAPAPTPSPKELPEPAVPSEKPPRPKPNHKAPKHPEAMRLAELLRDEIAARVEHWTPPQSLTRWAGDLDHMLRLDGPLRDGIPAHEIERVIRWVVRDPFEQRNVQSAGKLRKRFGALSAKSRPAGYDPDIERHKAWLRENPTPDPVPLDPNNMPEWALDLIENSR